MRNLKFIQKFKNSSLETKIKVISLVFFILAAAGLIVHKLSIPETKAYFRREKYSDVKLTVTDNVYEILAEQIQSDISKSALQSVIYNVYGDFINKPAPNVDSVIDFDDIGTTPQDDEPEEDSEVTDDIDNKNNE